MEYIKQLYKKNKRINVLDAYLLFNDIKLNNKNYKNMLIDKKINPLSLQDTIETTSDLLKKIAIKYNIYYKDIGKYFELSVKYHDSCNHNENDDLIKCKFTDTENKLKDIVDKYNILSEYIFSIMIFKTKKINLNKTEVNGLIKKYNIDIIDIINLIDNDNDIYLNIKENINREEFKKAIDKYDIKTSDMVIIIDSNNGDCLRKSYCDTTKEDIDMLITLYDIKVNNNYLNVENVLQEMELDELIMKYKLSIWSIEHFLIYDKGINIDKEFEDIKSDKYINYKICDIENDKYVMDGFKVNNVSFYLKDFIYIYEGHDITSYYDLVKKHMFSDIVIEINEKTYWLHEDIIKTKSKYFELMTNSNFMKEKQKINICDKNGKILNIEYVDHVIKYIYNKKITFRSENILECYHIAKILIIEPLIEDLYWRIVIGLIKLQNKNLESYYHKKKSMIGRHVNIHTNCKPFHENIIVTLYNSDNECIWIECDESNRYNEYNPMYRYPIKIRQNNTHEEIIDYIIDFYKIFFHIYSNIKVFLKYKNIKIH